MFKRKASGRPDRSQQLEIAHKNQKINEPSADEKGKWRGMFLAFSGLCEWEDLPGELSGMLYAFHITNKSQGSHTAKLSQTDALIPASVTFAHLH